MSGPAAFDVKEQVRQANDIVDLVGGYLQLRRQGRNYVALCPWHDDTRPSLQINPERQSWKCWVCDIGGDVFNFIMQREGVGFREALSMLAERAGIEMKPARRAAPVTPGSPEDKQTLYRAMAWAEEQYHRCLVGSAEAEAARRYLAERGVSAESIERFRLGFAPNAWQWILDRARTTPFSPAVLEAVGLVANSPKSGKPYDRFRGRVLFPIRDVQGRPIALGGRILPDLADAKAAKYINSPETRLFSKSDQLYGLDVARDAVAKRREVIVVEGYTDVIMAHQLGVGNVVAVLGTALGPRHVRLLRRYADVIALVLDGDEAGRRRTNEILELFIAEQVDLRIVTLPSGLDPCDFLLERGADAMRRLLADEAVDALEHRIRTETAGLDLRRDVHAGNRALENILATMAKAPRLRSDTTGAMRLREQQFLVRLAREFDVPETDLRGRLKELRSRHRKPGASKPAAPDAEHDWKLSDAKERELLEILALQPDLVERADRELPEDHLSGGAAREIYRACLRLYVAGRPVGFESVLTELEDSQLKHLWVDVEEAARDKAAAASEDAATRLTALVRDFHYRHGEPERRAKISALREGRYNEEEKLRILLELHQEQRDRQGISAPTDG